MLIEVYAAYDVLWQWNWDHSLIHSHHYPSCKSITWYFVSRKCFIVHPAPRPLFTKQQDHYCDVIIARWRLKSPASRLFTQSLIEAQIKKTSKLRVTGLCAGNSPVTGEFPAQMSSNAENVSIWWRQHDDFPPGSRLNIKTVFPRYGRFPC